MKKKKPIFKKWWFWIIVVIIIGGIGSAIDGKEDKSEEPVKETTAKPQEEKTKVPDNELTKEESIKKAVEIIIKEDFKDTTIIQLQVNENMGLDDGSYIVLPYLNWSVKNSPKTTKEMLEMYSEHLATKLADEDVSELTVFWEVPYHKEGSNLAKFNYIKNEKGMVVGKHWFDPIIR